MKVVTDPHPFDNPNGLFAINNIGFGGINCHLLLQRNSKIKTQLENITSKLVCVSGRTKEAVEVLLDEVLKNEDDLEYVALLHNIFRYTFQ